MKYAAREKAVTVRVDAKDLDKYMALSKAAGHKTIADWARAAFKDAYMRQTLASRPTDDLDQIDKILEQAKQ